ncbi:MAG: PaaI family thioesterase [Bacteroidales bacterium]|nr:PaaI family thioesterase [Bacteroidales bacterium]
MLIFIAFVNSDGLNDHGIMDVKDFFKNDRFAECVGIEILEASEGRARTRLEIKDEHLNAMNMAHGGAIFTLADLTFAVASNSHGNVAVALNVNISFVKSAGKGMLYADAVETSKNHKIATYSIIIKNAQDELIASAQGMAYRKKELINRVD